MEHNTTKTTWWIAHNNKDVFHYSSAEEGQKISSGQPFFETFDNKVEWETRLQELLPSDKYIEFNETKELEDFDASVSPVDELDYKLYTDKVEHLLYEDRGFRFENNPLRNLLKPKT